VSLREGGGLPKCEEGGHLLPPDGAPLLSLWPPSTLLTPGETLPHPPSTPQDLQGPATVPGSQAEQWPSQFPFDFSVGAVASTPQRLHSQLSPSDRDRFKNKNQIKGDKWRGAGRCGDGGGGGLCILLLSLLPCYIGRGYNLVMSI
jgi:hypothetical protein